MSPESRQSLIDAISQSLNPLGGKLLKLRIADVRQPEGRDVVISLSLNGNSVQCPSPVQNSIGRIDVWLPGATKAAVTEHGLIVGAMVQTRFTAFNVKIREVKATVDPVSGNTSADGGVFADVDAQIDHLAFISRPKLFTEVFGAVIPDAPAPAATPTA